MRACRTVLAESRKKNLSDAIREWVRQACLRSRNLPLFLTRASADTWGGTPPLALWAMAALDEWGGPPSPVESHQGAAAHDLVASTSRSVRVEKPDKGRQGAGGKKPAKPAAKTPRTFYIATGRRKTAVARVRVTEGKGVVLINGRPLEEYFHEDKDRAAVLGPLKVTDQLTRVDVFVNAKGGGVTGQAGAVCQGLARAMKTMFSPKGEQRAKVFDTTTVIKAYRDEKQERERAKTIPTKATAPAALIPHADGQPLITGTAPAAPNPVDAATGLVKKLRDSGYLTRDARMKERKKYGLRGARRGTQFSKR